MTRAVHYKAAYVPRPVATSEDVARMWTLRKLGYTWLMIAQALGLSMYAIMQAKRQGALAQEDKA